MLSAVSYTSMRSATLRNIILLACCLSAAAYAVSCYSRTPAKRAAGVTSTMRVSVATPAYPCYSNGILLFIILFIILILDGDDRERQSLLSSPAPTAGDGRHDDAHTLSSSGPEEVQFSDYPFLNSIAGWLMDLLRYDKSEVHIDYSEYLEESDQTFSTNSPIRHGHSHSHGKDADKDKFAAQGGLPDEGAFNALSKQSSPNRGNSSSSSSPLFVG
jgi:hypothetical protein